MVSRVLRSKGIKGSSDEFLFQSQLFMKYIYILRKMQANLFLLYIFMMKSDDDNLTQSFFLSFFFFLYVHQNKKV